MANWLKSPRWRKWIAEVEARQTTAPHPVILAWARQQVSDPGRAMILAAGVTRDWHKDRAKADAKAATKAARKRLRDERREAKAKLKLAARSAKWRETHVPANERTFAAYRAKVQDARASNGPRLHPPSA